MRLALTIFTPTFNRFHTLERLYNSLLAQTFTDFEWLIVDDGSTDDTETLVKSIINENKLKITYVKQKNGGKHRAINQGAKMASGIAFFIVDSDDYLPHDSLQIIMKHYKQIEFDPSIAGVVGLKSYFDGCVVGTQFSKECIKCNSLDYKYKYKIRGDRAEVFKTDILKKYPFPEFEGERFISESIVWDRIGQKYKLLYFNTNVYFCEYLEDGLSSKSVLLRTKNPIGATALYSELSMYEIPFIHKIKANINYWRFSKYTNLSFKEQWSRVSWKHSIFGLFCSQIFRFLDRN